MTDVFTCSYRLYHPSMGLPVVCSLGRPRNHPGFAAAAQCWPLTPRFSYFRKPDAGEQFEAQLARYGAEYIAKQLHQLATETGASALVLLCFEADWATCHRRRIARFMLEETGWLIRELGPPAGPQQLTLDA